MKRFGVLQGFYLSFFSADLYRDVAKNWTGIGLLYLLLLLAITWLPSGFRVFTSLTTFSTEKGAALAQQMPRVTIGNGEMRAEPPGRHEVKDPATGEVFLVIDDTIDEVPSDAANDMMVLARKEFGTFQRNQRRVWKLAPGFNYELTSAKVQAFLSRAPYWAAPLTYVGAVAGSFVFRTLQILVYGGIALWFARRFKAGMNYQAAVRLAAVAVTPVIVLRTLIWFTPTEPRWYIRWPVAFVITVLLIRFGVRAAAEPETVATVPV
jgi:hypothetical protein